MITTTTHVMHGMTSLTHHSCHYIVGQKVPVVYDGTRVPAHLLERSRQLQCGRDMKHHCCTSTLVTISDTQQPSEFRSIIAQLRLLLVFPPEYLALKCD
jgi:hypothetical protein